MQNIPWYKTLIAVISTSIIEIGILALYLTLIGTILTREYVLSNSKMLYYLIGGAIAITCFLIGRLYLKYAKDEHKHYYHTLWTGGWSVAVIMLIIVAIYISII
jgi:hypothetical protein